MFNFPFVYCKIWKKLTRAVLRGDSFFHSTFVYIFPWSDASTSNLVHVNIMYGQTSFDRRTVDSLMKRKNLCNQRSAVLTLCEAQREERCQSVLHFYVLTVHTFLLVCAQRVFYHSLLKIIFIILTEINVSHESSYWSLNDSREWNRNVLSYLIAEKEKKFMKDSFFNRIYRQANDAVGKIKVMQKKWSKLRTAE